MSLDSTALMQEVDLITRTENDHTAYRIDINILAGDGSWINPIRVDFYQLIRNYGDGSYGDLILVEALILNGDFQYGILPYRDNLRCDVQFVPLKLNSTLENSNKRTRIKRYRCIADLRPNEDKVLSNKDSQLTSRVALNQVGAKPYRFQLIEESVYFSLMFTVGKNFINVAPYEILYSYLKQSIEKFQGPDDERLIDVNIEPGYSVAKRKVISIPDGTLLKDLPTMLQNDKGGVYSTGLGRYIQNQYIYVYSLYDITKYQKGGKILNVINIPSDRLLGAERTYRDTPDALTVLCTGGSRSQDDGLYNMLNSGSGYRFGDASRLMGDYAISKNNRMYVDRAKNVYEVKGDGLKTGYNNIRWTKERFTSNPFKHYSDLALKQGQAILTEWQNSNSELLTPGMPVKYQTIDNNVVKTYYGVLLSVDEQFSPQDGSPNPNKHVGIATLGLFINRIAEADTQPSF